MVANNLPSGYFRDLQIIEDIYIPFGELRQSLKTLKLLQKIEVNKAILDNNCYVDVQCGKVNRLALKAFRLKMLTSKWACHRKTIVPQKTINHTHEGSMGNLCNEKIAELKLPC